jgi:hypothetical protein
VRTASSSLRAVLLDAQDIGSGFIRAAGTDWFDDIPDLGCLVFIDKLIGMPAPRHRERRRIVADTDAELPAIVQTVARYRSATDAATALKAYTIRMSSCHHVDKTSKQYGERYRLAVRTDHLPADGSVEQELNISAVGTIHYDDDPDDYDTGTWFSLMRIGSYLLTTAYDDADHEEYGGSASLDRALAQRLAAFVDGEPVPDFAPLDIEPSEFGEDRPTPGEV